MSSLEISVAKESVLRQSQTVIRDRVVSNQSVTSIELLRKAVNAFSVTGLHSVSSTRWLRKLVLKHLDKMHRGQLTVYEDGAVYEFGDKTVSRCEKKSSISVSAVIRVENPMVYQMIATNGVLGAAEAYIQGYWNSPDLLAVVRFMVGNLSALNGMNSQRTWMSRLALTLTRYLHRNSLAGSRRNIMSHYDLGNDFFALFLDPEMMYSSALFYAPHETAVQNKPANEALSLQQASISKLDTICRKLKLSAGEHLLEIGTGWGGMAVYAAEHYGVQVTTITISKQQYDYACDRVKARGLQDRITVLLKDYRELTGQYDKLVSIEMIEAVGHEYFSNYFRRCSRLLNPDGLMLIQAITIADQRYEQARRTMDFIRSYIFPGGCLPSLAVLSKHVADDTDMNIVDVSDMTADYAETLKCWRESFASKLGQVADMGFDERFIRMWEYYLCYCEGGFRERAIGTSQLLLAKPDYRRAL